MKNGVQSKPAQGRAALADAIEALIDAKLDLMQRKAHNKEQARALIVAVDDARKELHLATLEALLL